MAKLGKIKKGSSFVPPRIGENRTTITAEDINNLIEGLTSSSTTLVEITSEGEPEIDGKLVAPGPIYGPEEINDNFATIAVALNKINLILQEAGLIDEYEAPPDKVIAQAWLRCDDELTDPVYLNQADASLLEEAMAIGDWSSFNINIGDPEDPIDYAESGIPLEGEANWTFAELLTASIVYQEECPE
jgi:hypothetical protein